MHINTDYTTQFNMPSMPLEQFFAQNGVRRLTGTGIYKTQIPVQQTEQPQQIQPKSPALPSISIPSSYIPKAALSQPKPTVLDTPAITQVKVPDSTIDYSKFNLNDMLKSTIYEKDGKWVSDNPFTNRFIQIESSGNPRALNPSGAAGLYQFTPTTGAAYGLPGDTRYDPQKSHAAFLRLAQDNAAKLTKYGIPVTPANLYFMHQQGPGFWYIWQAAQKGVPIANAKIDRNMRNNLLPGMSRNISPADWISQWTAHFNKGL